MSTKFTQPVSGIKTVEKPHPGHFPLTADEIREAQLRLAAGETVDGVSEDLARRRMLEELELAEAEGRTT